MELAARRGCPCGLWALRVAARAGRLACLEAAWQRWQKPDEVSRLLQPIICTGRRGQAAKRWKEAAITKNEIGGALEGAASQGHADCLEALCCWLGEGSRDCIVDYALPAAMEKGHLECIQTIDRLCCIASLEWSVHFSAAAEGGQLACLKYVFAQERRPSEHCLLIDAARSKSMDALRFLHDAGCPWTGGEPHWAAGDPEALRFCLQHVSPWCWDSTMVAAVERKCPPSMELLYMHGYERHRSRDPARHPAVVASQDGNLACMELAMSKSGAPDVRLLSTLHAARTGEDMLRFVRGLGVPFHPQTATVAASYNKAGALQYALQHGAPCDGQTFYSALTSLDCFRCLVQHACVVGYPKQYRLYPGRIPDVKSPAVLHYIGENMSEPWARPIMATVAGYLAQQAYMTKERFQHNTPIYSGDPPPVYVDWRLVLLFAKGLKAPLPTPLDEMVEARRERAGALAGAFTRAGKLAVEDPSSRSHALWAAMARMPPDLRERIAAEAQLIISWEELKAWEPAPVTHFTDAD
eukprot:jgi/Botrbrau1/10364/Bobra.146_2s0003.1